MQECKNRAAGSLEWKEDERFVEWTNKEGMERRLEQEIDALKAENERLRNEIRSLKRPNKGIEGLLMNGMLTMTASPGTKGE